MIVSDFNEKFNLEIRDIYNDLGNLFKSGGSDDILRFLRGSAGEEGAGLLGTGGKFIGQDFFTGGGGGSKNQLVNKFICPSSFWGYLKS